MSRRLPESMRAAAIGQFGGIGEIKVQSLPVPAIAADEVLIRVEYAGVGSWEPFEREGGYAEMMGSYPPFPYVLGSEGAGTVVAVGNSVVRFKETDRVYALGFLNPKGGFYAEYVAISANLVSLIPDRISTKQASVMGGVGVTALRGLQDTLSLQPGESIMIFGASGGMGHLAIQLAKRMGARVFAVAAGDDGVALARQVGADAAVDGYKTDVKARAFEFAPNGLDAALLTAGGDVADEAIQAIRDGGRIAYPSGVQPEPGKQGTSDIRNFNGEPDREIIDRFNQMITAGEFHVHIDRIFTLDQAAEAHEALGEHYLGKIVLKVA